MKISNEPLISVENLTVAYGARVVLRDLNFTVNRGDIFVIMGMSGCGKSTVLKTMVGLIKPCAGRIVIDNMDICMAGQDERHKILKKIGVSFQGGALFSSMTIGENIALPMELGRTMSQHEINRRVKQKLELVGMDGCEKFYPSEISGGMIKRAALARALALDPDILFFDEPSAGLDPVRARQLDELIQDINKTMGTTIVMVTHELPSIMEIATNSVYIDAHTHTNIGHGRPGDLLATTKNPQVREFLTRGTIQRGKK